MKHTEKEAPGGVNSVLYVKTINEIMLITYIRTSTKQGTYKNTVTAVVKL